MNPNLSYQEFTEGLKGLEIPSLAAGKGMEGAKRLAFLLIWLKFQFGWRLGRWEQGIHFKYRSWIYLGILISLISLTLLPVFVQDYSEHKSISPMAITLPQLPTESAIAPDTLLNHVSLNPLCNDEYNTGCRTPKERDFPSGHAIDSAPDSLSAAL